MQREAEGVSLRDGNPQKHAGIFGIADLSFEVGDLLNELDHFVLLDGAAIVLVELGEALIEVVVVKLTAIRHVDQSVLDKLPGLFFVEVAVAIGVVLAPDFVDALFNHFVDLLRCHSILL